MYFSLVMDSACRTESLALYFICNFSLNCLIKSTLKCFALFVTLIVTLFLCVCFYFCNPTFFMVLHSQNATQLDVFLLKCSMNAAVCTEFHLRQRKLNFGTVVDLKLKLILVRLHHIYWFSFCLIQCSGDHCLWRSTQRTIGLQETGAWVLGGGDPGLQTRQKPQTTGQQGSNSTQVGLTPG